MRSSGGSASALRPRGTSQRLATVALALGAVAAGVGAQAPGAAGTRMVDVGGHRLRVRVAGGAPRVTGRPTVVFESGLGGRLESWDPVQPRVASLTTTVAYDRAGNGGSEPAPDAPSPEHVAAELRALLERLGAPPPYVLVGTSLGGVYVRAFAGRYPGETAGLVFVDPTDFTQTQADRLAAWREAGLGGGPEFSDSVAVQSFAKAPPSVRAEYQEFDRAFKSDFAELRQLPMPDVPVVVLLAGQFNPPPPNVKFPGDYNAYMEVSLRQRIEHMGRLTRRVAEGTLHLTPNSGHGIQRDEPDLVIWAIRRALFPDVRRRVSAALEQGGTDSAVRVYRRLKSSHPASAFDASLLEGMGQGLMWNDRYDDALAVMRLNVEEYPRSSQAHAGLADAYAVRHDWDRAIRELEEALRLDPANQYARVRLEKVRKRRQKP